ncbi:hypothetical protein SDD27957_10815 [Streptococcus dysgalactiae subsp. dysgalactiae ATCC 27957]|nr:hypothetical protein SDD27957_10815 [Streptococcus dysgalactiae subsp. dysgalactiae ATCC 27957]
MEIINIKGFVEGTLRFGQLKASIGTVSKKVLTAQLRAMEADGLVHREVYAEVPPRVEYSLTETGLSLSPVIEVMSDWGQSYQEKHVALFEEA